MFHVETKINLTYFNEKKFFKDFTRQLFYSRRLDLKSRSELGEKLLYETRSRIFSGADVAELKKSTIFRKRHESSFQVPFMDKGNLLKSLKSEVGKKGRRDITIHFSGVSKRGMRYDTLARWLTEGLKGPFIGQVSKGKPFHFWGRPFASTQYGGYTSRKPSTQKEPHYVIATKRSFPAPALRPRRLLLNDTEVGKIVREFMSHPKFVERGITVEVKTEKDVPIEKVTERIGKMPKRLPKAQQEAFDYMTEDIGGKGGT